MAQYTALQAERSVRLGASLLVLCSALALILSQKMIFSAAVLLLMLPVAWFWPKRSGGKSLWELASFLYLVFFFIDLIRISGSLASSLVHLFVFIIVNKLFNLNSARDYHQLYLLTFLTMLAATSMSVEIEMFYSILTYIVLLIWNIASLTLYQEWKRESSDTHFPISLFSPRYILVVLGASVTTFGIAMSIFFLLPRMQLGFFADFRQGKVQYVSGFSQKVTLGDINSIQADPNLAMRIRVTPGPLTQMPSSLYWRGIAFDHYDGASWSSTVPGSRFLFRDSGGFYFSGPQSGSLDTLIRQEVYMEPLETRVVFGLDRIVRLYGPYGEVSRNSNNTLTSMGRLKSYEAYSRYTPVSLEQLRRTPDNLSEPIRRYYLQLANHSDRIAELARSVTATQGTTIDRIYALRNHLQKNYGYSTTELPMSSIDPISEFLFQRKVGHCEYFASSLVILLRHIGIPARLVNGFREGEYNPIGGFYMVRNSDAHSWAEAYVGEQWIPLDPSPIAQQVDGGTIVAFFNLRKVLDSVSFFWDRYILIFSGQDQMDAFTDARDRYRDVRRSLKRKYKDSPQNLLDGALRTWQMHRYKAAIGIALTALIVASLRIWLRSRRRAKVSRTPVLFYREMLTILHRKGIERPAHATPAEFIREIEGSVPNECKTDLDLITVLFYRARYGKYELTLRDQSSVAASLRRLERM